MKIRKSNSSVRNALVSVIGFRDLILDPYTPDNIAMFAEGRIFETFAAIREITQSPQSNIMINTLQSNLGNLDHAAIDRFVHLWAAGE